MSSSSDSGISISTQSLAEVLTARHSQTSNRSKSPFAEFKDEQTSTSSSDSGISISSQSTAEFLTARHSQTSNRSMSPFAEFKDEQTSTRGQVSEWLNLVEIQSPELQDPEEELSGLHSARVLHERSDGKGDGACDDSNWQNLVGIVSLVGAAGLIAIMCLFKF